MKKILVYKNEHGYGPKTRPDISVGDEPQIISDDGAINTSVRVVQVPRKTAGTRCILCSMARIDNNTGNVSCWCNSQSLSPQEHRSICTIRSESMDGVPGIYTIFKQIGAVLEEL